MRGGRLSLKMRLGVAVLALAVLMPAAGAGLMAVQPVSGIGLVESLVGRAIFRTISHRKEERVDRKNINERRDAELAEVAQLQQALDFTRDRGWRDQATYDQETARLVGLVAAINERAKRERQIVSYETRRKIRGDWTRAVEDVLTVSTGLNPRAVRFTGSLVRGERPITAAIGAALGDAEAVDPRDQFLDLQRTLTDVEGGIRFVRDNAGLIARAQMTRMVQEMTGLPVRTPAEAEAALERLRELGVDVESAVTQAGAIRNDLAPRSSRIDRERFADNERWIMLNGNVNALSESTAEKAVASAILRRAQERAEELLEGSGVNLTDEQLAAIVREAAAGYTAARLRDGEVVDAAAVDMDKIVRAAANQALVTAGRDPLPASGPAGASNGSDAVTPVVTLASTASPTPTATATPSSVETLPPGATATPTTAETLPPGATATPTTVETTPPGATATPVDDEIVVTEGTFDAPFDRGNHISLTFSSSGGDVSGQLTMGFRFPICTGGEADFFCEEGEVCIWIVVWSGPMTGAFDGVATLNGTASATLSETIEAGCAGQVPESENRQLSWSGTFDGQKVRGELESPGEGEPPFAFTAFVISP